MVKTELIPCKEERYNCPVYDYIDILTGALDAEEDLNDELIRRLEIMEEENAKLKEELNRRSDAMSLLANYFVNRVFEEAAALEQVEDQPSMFDDALIEEEPTCSC